MVQDLKYAQKYFLVIIVKVYRTGYNWNWPIIENLFVTQHIETKVFIFLFFLME
jgi:hypothetical protein